MMQLMTVVVMHQKQQVAPKRDQKFARIHFCSAGPECQADGAARDPLGETYGCHLDTACADESVMSLT